MQQREEQKRSQARPKTEKPRFQIVKLEERIAPRYGHQHPCNKKHPCYGYGP